MVISVMIFARDSLESLGVGEKRVKTCLDEEPLVYRTASVSM